MHQNQRRWIHQIPWRNEGRGWNGDGARSAPYGRSYSLYRPFPEGEDGCPKPIPVGVVVVGCILCTRTNGRKYTRFPGEMKTGDPSKMVHGVHPTGGDTNPSAFHEGKAHPHPAFEVFLPKWLRHPRLRCFCRSGFATLASGGPAGSQPFTKGCQTNFYSAHDGPPEAPFLSPR